MRAVATVLQRAERQENVQKLIGTFVDVGLLPQLENRNHQIFYGRRGTGKTHVLRVLESKLREDNRNTVVYIDARTLGSTAQFSDSTIPLQKRCISLFRDILSEIHNALLEHIVYFPTNSATRAEQALTSLDELASSTHDDITTIQEDTRTTSTSLTDTARSSASASITSLPAAELKVRVGGEKEAKGQVDSSYTVSAQDKIIFPSLHKHLSDILDLGDTYLYILLDEWSSIPIDIQPYLAEFLKRGVLPMQKATLKVASLEYRSHFALPNTNPIFGFELGADIATAPDLDDYYVFDRSPEQVTDAYADMLLRHLNSELPDGYFQDEYRVSDGKDFASRLFTQRDTFKELARASEGVVRDLINIFNNSFFHAVRRQRDDIDRKAIIEGSQQWFEQDKQRHLDDKLQTVLQRIIHEVIGKKNARSFLLPSALVRHSVIQRLFDLRILHLMTRGYADKDNPGTRYNIYTLDYGTYVDLIGTSKQPSISLVSVDAFGMNESETDIVVPFDDKRSIRRIILDEKVLS